MRFLCICLVACAGSAATPMVVATERATLGVGDVFEARVYQEPDLSGAYRVGSDGTVRFPLLGKLQVAGLGSGEAADLISARLKEGYLKNPQVSVTVKEYNSKKVFVLGQVARPGAYSYAEDMSIVNAIASAGGFTRSAAPNRINVTRVVKGDEVRMTVRMDDIGKGEEKNVPLAPGDIVFVPESLF